MFRINARSCSKHVCLRLEDGEGKESREGVLLIL